jgi:hypothetical protein
MDNGEWIEGGMFCECAVISVVQNIAYFMDNGERFDCGKFCESALKTL